MRAFTFIAILQVLTSIGSGQNVFIGSEKVKRAPDVGKALPLFPDESRAEVERLAMPKIELALRRSDASGTVKGDGLRLDHGEPLPRIDFSPDRAFDTPASEVRFFDVGAASRMSAHIKTELKLPDWPVEFDPLAPPETGGNRPGASAIDLESLAIQAGSAIVVVKAWDRYGFELRAGCGFIANPQGRVIADGSLLTPDVAKRLDYYTAVGGDGKVYRVAGIMGFDDASSLALLALEVPPEGVPSLPLNEKANFGQPLDVAIAARIRERDLSLADATLDGTRENADGSAWLKLAGHDTAATPGSPVLDRNGAVLAVVTVKVVGDGQRNYAIPAAEALGLLNRFAASEKFAKATRFVRPGGSDITQDQTFIEIYESLLSNDTKGALRNAQRLVESNPRSGAAYGLFGLALERAGQMPEALTAFEKAVELQPDNAELWKQLGLAYRRDDKREASVEAMRQAVQLRHDDALAWHLIGEHHAGLGQWKAASDALQKAALLDPGNPLTLYLLGFAEAKAGRLIDSESALRCCVNLKPDYSRAWFHLGLIYQKQRRLKDATSSFRKAVTHDPANAPAWLNLAHALKNGGSSAEATKAFRQYLTVSAKR